MVSENKKYVKYPRTFHLPWSDGATDDDKVLSNTDSFRGKEVVVTEKMDGENTTMYDDHIHARSIDSKYHPSRSFVKGLWSEIKHRIPASMRICGENMYAVHSIVYTELPAYFLVFSIWNDVNCVSWDETEAISRQLGFHMVPVLYRGIYDEELIKSLYDKKTMEDSVEGYVVRLADSFSMDEFSSSVGKYVRENHVQTDQHWMKSGLELNMLKIKK